MTDDNFDPHELHPDDFLKEVHSFEFWFQSVDGYLSDRPYGRLEASNDVPIQGAAREALITTLCNYCVGETAALEGASGMIAIAPNRHSKIFLATQVADEARHLEVFLHRLGELGVADAEAEIARRANPNLVRFKQRLLELVGTADWAGALFAQNVILETMEAIAFDAHAQVADPITAQILDGVVKDERRHLGFGENDLGRLLQDDPDARVRLGAIRQELDALVLAAFDGALTDAGSVHGDRPTLGRDYLATIDRLGLV
jgi:1,2-phenylacetyl-CoA epoxidase catalytic subunit